MGDFSIGDMQGLLYRKLFKKQKPKHEIDNKSRAARMSKIIKQQHTEHLVVRRKKVKKKKVKKNKHKFEKFELRTPTKLVLFGHNTTRSMHYILVDPHVHVRITKNPVENEFVYYVMEPELSNQEKIVLSKVKEGLIQTIDIKLSTVKKEETLFEYLEGKIQDLIDEYGFDITQEQYDKIMYYIYRDFVGLNEIEALMLDPYIEDIGCDGVGVPIYIVHKRYGSIKTNIVFKNEDYLKELVVKMAERCNRYISYANPLLDGSLPDGTRVQASMAGDVTTRGPTFSIRKFTESPFTPVEIIKLGTASEELLSYLWFLVENGTNILVCGGVATGKTTLLNAISLFIPPELKIVSIEDTRELRLPHENWIPGVVRLGFGSDMTGEVTLFDLLKESFRQNPDYLIVGEIRGEEASVMFQGMSSGHPTMSTMHAGSVDAVVKRLETPPINLSPGLIDSLDLVIVMVHAREKGKSTRRIRELVEIESVNKDTGNVKSNKPFIWLPAVDNYEFRGNSYLLQKISIEKGFSMKYIQKELVRRKKVLEWIIDQDITDWHQVAEIISQYTRDPKGILKRVKNDLNKNKKV